MSRTKKAILALIIANIVWGSSPALSKWTLQDIPIATLAFLRFFIPVLIILLFNVRKAMRIPKHFLLVVLGGFLGITVNIAFFFIGVRQTASINVPIIGSCGPLFLLLGSVIFLKEKPRKKVIVGNVVGFLGILLIVIQPLFHAQTSSFIGNFYLIIATIASAVSTILMKDAIRKNDPLVITFWSFVVGAVSFLPFFMKDLNQAGFLAHFTAQGIFGIAYSVLLPSLLAYFLYYWSLKYFPASQVGIFTYLDPIVAVVLAAPLLQEYPDSTFLLGTLVVVIGMYIAEGRIPYHPLRRLFTTK